MRNLRSRAFGGVHPSRDVHGLNEVVQRQLYSDCIHLLRAWALDCEGQNPKFYGNSALNEKCSPVEEGFAGGTSHPRPTALSVLRFPRCGAGSRLSMACSPSRVDRVMPLPANCPRPSASLKEARCLILEASILIPSPGGRESFDMAMRGKSVRMRALRGKQEPLQRSC